jgi:hypothetical protein
MFLGVSHQQYATAAANKLHLFGVNITLVSGKCVL